MNSKNVIIRENEVFEQGTPFEARAAFTGFNNQRLKFTVEYKLTHKNYFENAISTNTKLEVLINELKAFGISRVTNDTYFTQEFYIDNLTDFDFIIKKYPALSRSSWELALTQSGSAESNLALYDLVNQNQLIGYLDLSETNTSSGTLALLLQTSLNGNDFQFGASDQGQLMALDGTPISLTPGANYKLIFTLEEGWSSVATICVGTVGTPAASRSSMYRLSLFQRTTGAGFHIGAAHASTHAMKASRSST